MSQVINEFDKLKKKLEYNDKLSNIEYKNNLSLYLKALQYENEKIREKELDEERENLKNINYYQSEINQIESQTDDLILNLTKLGVSTPERKTSGGEKILDTIIQDGSINVDLAKTKLKQERDYREQLITTIETLNFQTTKLNNIVDDFAGANLLLQPKEYQRAIKSLKKEFPEEFLDTKGLDKIYGEKMKPTGSELKAKTIDLINYETNNVTTGGANNIYSTIQTALQVPEEGTIDDVKLQFRYYDNNGNLVQPSDEQVLKLQKLATSTTAPVFLSNLRAIDSTGELQTILSNAEVSGMNYSNMVMHVDNIIKLENELIGNFGFPEDKQELISEFQDKVRKLTDPNKIFDLYHEHAATATSDIQGALWSIDEIQNIDNVNEKFSNWLGSKGKVTTQVGSSYISGQEMRKNREEITKIAAGYPEAEIFLKYNTPEKIVDQLKYLSHNIFKKDKLDEEGKVIGQWDESDMGLWRSQLGGSQQNMIYGNVNLNALGNPMFDDIMRNGKFTYPIAGDPGSEAREYTSMQPNWSFATSFGNKGPLGLGMMEQYFSADNAYYQEYYNQFDEENEAAISKENPWGPDFVHRWWRSNEESKTPSSVKERDPKMYDFIDNIANEKALEKQMEFFANLLNEAQKPNTYKTDRFWDLARVLDKAERGYNQVWKGFDDSEREPYVDITALNTNAGNNKYYIDTYNMVTYEITPQQQEMPSTKRIIDPDEFMTKFDFDFTIDNIRNIIQTKR